MFEQKGIKRNCADVSLRSVKQKKCKKDCIAEAFSSRRKTAAFPAQYVMSLWCPDPQSLWVHSEGQHVLHDLGGNMGRKKSKRDLSFRFMFLFDLLRCPKRVLSSCLQLSTPVMWSQPSSSSDPSKTHALATCASPFGFMTDTALPTQFLNFFSLIFKAFCNLKFEIIWLFLLQPICSDLPRHVALLMYLLPVQDLCFCCTRQLSTSLFQAFSSHTSRLL